MDNSSFKDSYLAKMNELGLTCEGIFVPFSVSRYAGDASKPYPKLSELSLNWKVSVCCKGRRVLVTDYSAGIAHCPSYVMGEKATMHYYEKIMHEVEKGTKYGTKYGTNYGTKKKIELNEMDAMYAIISDTEVLDYSGFEEWAKSLGLNPDSIKYSKAYAECLSNTLSLRSAIGDAGVSQLREIFSEY